MFALRKKYFFSRKRENDKKKVNLKNQKSPKIAKYQDLGFQLFKFKLFCYFWFPIKKIFCFSKQIYFCLTKTICEADNINKEEDIL